MNRLTLFLCAALLAGCAPLTPPPHGERIYRDQVYASPQGRKLRIDIYTPARPEPLPLVIWIHGGGWKYGNKGYRLFLRNLTHDGFAVASVEYRLSTMAKYPAQIEDCRAALLWLKNHAAAYHLDPHRIFLAGDSAGGHLSALLGIEEGASRIRAVCAIYPATDLTGFPNKDRPSGFIPDLLGGSVNQKHDLAVEGSPVTHVTPASPPFFMIHGDKDTLVPIAQSHELDRKLRAAGVSSRLEVVHGAGHGFSLTPAQIQEVSRFFKDHL